MPSEHQRHIDQDDHLDNKVALNNMVGCEVPSLGGMVLAHTVINQVGGVHMSLNFYAHPDNIQPDGSLEGATALNYDYRFTMWSGSLSQGEQMQTVLK